MQDHASFIPATDTQAASVLYKAIGRFSIEVDVAYPHMICLMVADANSGGASSIWARHFGDLADRDAVLERFQAGALDLLFLAHVTMIFGPAAITGATDRAVKAARKNRDARAETEEKRQRDHKVINLYALDTKRGHKLELQRKSDGHAEWSVRYDRASERDRLCDWLRWQKERFGVFLDHAAEHGAEALTRLLIDEMFETESRIKKEGRGAGGMRPLRMWRGD
ncbi:hypothetical protein EJC47_00695 [Sphingomonas sp. TF3]|uniref:hypothetical protein n=1 Tax=Sphingomonas sp. TF3 TaxID=2495580 RepID=UPI000F8757EF|nr:hypothetical protein [Sphingomonas sp. TF3]RUN78427.1 hypothetical protein EJC47_00695 [Sphingomonas sp. TF3]